MPSNVGAQTPNPTTESDRAVLVALYNATDGPNWVNDANWLSEVPIRHWHGVVTSYGSVTELQLNSNGLRGEIPPELGDLTNLRTVFLAGNQLSGTIPREISNLAGLQTLVLSRNQLSGTVPPELGNLTNLGWLNISWNQLSGTIPTELARLENLQFLDLSGNQLSGALPTELGNLKQLYWFFFHSNVDLCVSTDFNLRTWLHYIPNRAGCYCSGAVSWRDESEMFRYDRNSVHCISAPTPGPDSTVALEPASAATPVPELTSPPTPKLEIERGFFANSVPSPDDVEADLPFDILDPVTLSLIGVIVTLGATAIQLFRGK